MLTKILLVVLLVTNFVSLSSVVAKTVYRINRLAAEDELRLQKELETNAILDSYENFETLESLKHDDTNATSASMNKIYIPLVYWHGMGDNAWNVKRALGFIEQQLPGVYVNSIQIGANIAEDMENGYFMNVNEQVEMVCKMLKDDPQLQGGYNAIGLSQGAQFLRAVAQRCPDPPMFNLISLGGQHQGVFGVPKCSAPKKEWCEIIDKLLTHVAYAGWVQKFLVQAEYWHDPFKNEEYITKSVFLADINNERSINETYKTNLQRLQNFVLVLFEDDTIVEPKQSEWFGYFQVGSDKAMLPLENSPIYLEDRLGLKVMNEAGKLHFLSSPGDHLRFTEDWFSKSIIKPFLA